MYELNRKSDNAAGSDNDNASSTPRRLLLQSDLARALTVHDRSVRRKAAELQISASIADLASKTAQTAQLNDLQRQVKVLQERLATRPAPATSSSKLPPSASAPSPRSTARALAVASTTTPKRASARLKDFGPARRNCAHCHGRHLAPGQGLRVPPSRLCDTGLRWASHLLTPLAASRPRTPRRIRPPRRRSVPYRGTSRVQPYARRQITCARRPPRHFLPCSPGLFHATPPRGIAP